jgi:hypothetical protein
MMRKPSGATLTSEAALLLSWGAGWWFATDALGRGSRRDVIASVDAKRKLAPAPAK